MERARQAFEYADTEAKGTLTKHQYKVAMTAAFGYCPEKWEVKQALESHFEKMIPYEHFKAWFWKKLCLNDNATSLEILFSYLDKDFKGYLTVKDLSAACNEVNLKTSSSFQKRIFKELDRYQKGYIGLDDFLFLTKDTSH